MTTKNHYRWTVSRRSFLVEGLWTEDGERPLLTRWEVVCEDTKGNRYAYKQQFPTEFRAWVFECRARKALRQGAVPRYSTKWHRVEPCYGSPAYEAYGQAEEVQWEKDIAARGY